MKLRISGNSLRLRLTRSEVEEFAATGSYENSIDLAGGTLVYRLEKADIASPSAVLSGTTVTVLVPAPAADAWTGSDEVSIDASDNRGLKVLIEKDFACLNPRPGEDTDDHYPHPATGATC